METVARIRRGSWVRWTILGAALAVGSFGTAAALTLLVPRGGGRQVEFVVTPGMTLGQVAARLADAEIIRSRWAFRLAGRVAGVDTRVKRGRYPLSSDQSSVDILRLLDEGRVALLRFTIPEGLTVEQTAEIIDGQTGVTAEAFLAHVRSVDASSLLGFPADGMEGYLFPDTYLITEDGGAEDIVDTMVEAFHRAVGDSFAREAWSVGLTPHEVVTLASLIEKEAQVAEERPRISAVFHNRLARGRRLEADPTVRYALKRWTGRLTYEALEVDSPYNTYRVAGLPPGPIASPGTASIDAALHPAPGVDDLYFVARGDGSHQFSKTLEAHLRAKEALKRTLRSRRSQPG